MDNHTKAVADQQQIAMRIKKLRHRRGVGSQRDDLLATLVRAQRGDGNALGNGLLGQDTSGWPGSVVGGLAAPIARRRRKVLAKMEAKCSIRSITLAHIGFPWHDMPMKLDVIDQRILTVLQRDGRCPNNQLASEVGLSPSPCLRRVRLMEEAGVIERYAAIIDPAKVGMGMTVFARVWLSGQDEDQVERFVAAVSQLAQIVECHLMAGDCDFLLRIVAPDLQGVRRFQAEHLARIEGVRSIKTDIPMQRVKLATELPLAPDARS